jgi:hypothetical protein
MQTEDEDLCGISLICLPFCFVLRDFSCVDLDLKTWLALFFRKQNKETMQKIYKSVRELTCVHIVRMRELPFKVHSYWIVTILSNDADVFTRLFFIEFRKLSENLPTHHHWWIKRSSECCDTKCDSWKQQRSCHNIFIDSDESESFGAEK